MLTIMCEDGCPSGKCLVKNNEGHCELIKCALFWKCMNNKNYGSGCYDVQWVNVGLSVILTSEGRGCIA